MTISLIQSAKGDGTASATFASANTLGNLLIATGFDGNGNPSNPTVSDTAGNTWTRINFQNGGGAVTASVFCAVNCKAASAGNVVTLANGGGLGFPAMIVSEWSSTAGAAALQIATGLSGGNGTNGTGSSASTPLVVTDTGNILLIGAWIPDAAGETAGSGFTLVQDCTSTAALQEYKLVSGAATYNVTASGNNGFFALVGAAFKETGGAQTAPSNVIFKNMNF